MTKIWSHFVCRCGECSNHLVYLSVQNETIQLQESFAFLVSFSSLSSVVNQQLLVTNEGRNLSRDTLGMATN